MIEIQIPVCELKAAALFASRDITRYILNGVFVQIPASGKITLTATDGRRIARIQSEGEVVSRTEDAAGAVSFIIPTKLIAKARPIPKMASGSCVMRIERLAKMDTAQGDPQMRIELDDLETRVSMKSTFGNFPKFAHLLSKESKKPAATQLHFNPNLFADFATAAKLLRRGKNSNGCTLAVGAESSTSMMVIRFQENPDFIGGLMPVRDQFGELDLKAPDWATTDIRDEAQAADTASKKEAA